MKKILFLLVAVIFCLPTMSSAQHRIHQFAIGAENINKRENRHMIDLAKGTKYAYRKFVFDRVYPDEGFFEIFADELK